MLTVCPITTHGLLSFWDFIWWLLMDCLCTAGRLRSLSNAYTSLHYWVQRTALSWETSDCSHCVNDLSHLLKTGRNTCILLGKALLGFEWPSLSCGAGVMFIHMEYFTYRVTKEWLEDPVEEKATEKLQHLPFFEWLSLI